MSAADLVAAAFLIACLGLQLVGLVTVGRWIVQALGRRHGKHARAWGREQGARTRDATANVGKAHTEA